ncbi:hypothetical protein MKX01_019697 [Papaver californicum]|nr:hypothetical protein MKX01_019697 [Papaver californicum]
MWDGSLVIATNNNGNCYVWRLQRGTQTMTNFESLHKLQAHDGYILKYMATASSYDIVKIWNVDDFSLDRALVGHKRWVWDCVFSVEGAYLITASSDTTSRLWGVGTGESIQVYQGHHKAVVCCALYDEAEPSAS